MLLVLWLQACSAPRVSAESTGVTGSETFSIVFLQKRVDFVLQPDFSSHVVAERFCARHGFPAQHVRAVRELVENAVADALGSDRVEAGMRGEVSHSAAASLMAAALSPSLISLRMACATDYPGQPLNLFREQALSSSACLPC
jgi:hypothetical protein